MPLKKLEESGFEDNAFAIFVTDNGAETIACPTAGNPLLARTRVPSGKGAFGDICSTGPWSRSLMAVFKACLNGCGQLKLPVDCEPGKHQKI